jgi:hypothetical protein
VEAVRARGSGAPCSALHCLQRAPALRPGRGRRPCCTARAAATAGRAAIPLPLKNRTCSAQMGSISLTSTRAPAAFMALAQPLPTSP